MNSKAEFFRLAGSTVVIEYKDISADEIKDSSYLQYCGI